MDYYQQLADNCQGIIEALAMGVDAAAPVLGAIAEQMVAAMLGEHKVLVCGAGADAALAQLFAIHLLGHFQQERPALPVLALGESGGILGAIAGSDGPDEIFARQLQALGQPGDVLLCIASAGSTPAILAALQTARTRNMGIALMSNGLDDALGGLVGERDQVLHLDAIAPARALERHTVLIQNLCEFIDHALFGSPTGNDL
ncbi:MAG: SIS domain-containing protein [Parahaliea sp.]